MRGVGGVCELGICLAQAGWDRCMWGFGLGIPIMWEQGECGACICVWIVSVEVGGGLSQCLVRWCDVVWIVVVYPLP